MVRWAILTISWVSTAFAAPNTILQQGRLIDAAGGPINGNLTLTIALHSQATGGIAQCSEDEPITVHDGYYSVVIGDGACDLTTLSFHDTTYWVGLTVSGSPELLPRSEIHAAPLALSALETAGNGGAVVPTPVSTSERDALVPVLGQIIYNSTASRLETWTGSSWDPLGVGTNQVGTGVFAWGQAETGGLGLGDEVDRFYPEEIEVPGGVRFVKMAAGGYSQGNDSTGCAIDTQQRLYCWGRGSNVPDGDSANINRPIEVSNGQQWRDVYQGFGLVSCGITTSNQAYCWGYQHYGGLGNGTSSTSYLYTAQPVVGGLSWKVLSPGGRYDGANHRAFLCGVSTQTGQANGYCWGNDNHGELGNGGSGYNPSSPGLILGFEWDWIETGSFHSCGVTVANDGFCWGEGGSGRLGRGSTTDAQTPVAISGGHDWAFIGTGEAHSCGLRTDGKIYCWGDASQYQTGRNTTTDNNTPLAISGNGTYQDLAVGYQHSCAIDMNDEMWCWGRGDSGRQGDGSAVDNRIPTKVQGNLFFSDVSAGIQNTMGTQR